jgi:hypothetical protein
MHPLLRDRETVTARDSTPAVAEQPRTARMLVAVAVICAASSTASFFPLRR